MGVAVQKQQAGFCHAQGSAGGSGRFRAAGKYPGLQHELERTRLLLSSVANTIVLNPMEIDGLSAQPLFLTGALEVRHWR